VERTKRTSPITVTDVRVDGAVRAEPVRRRDFTGLASRPNIDHVTTDELYPAGRLDQVREAAGAAGLDAVLLTPGPDLRYVIGYDAKQLERLTCLAVPAKGDPALFVPRLELAADPLAACHQPVAHVTQAGHHERHQQHHGRERIQRSFAAGAAIDREARRAQPHGDGIGDQVIVLYDQNAHLSMVARNRTTARAGAAGRPLAGTGTARRSARASGRPRA